MRKKPSPFKIEWDAYEHEYKERSSDWFWAVGIVSTSIAIASIIFGNVILGILILVGTFTLVLFINKEPDKVHVMVTEQGVTRGKIHYPYYTLASYWLDSEHPHPKLLLRSQKFFLPILVVPLDTSLAEEVDKTLVQFIPEEEHSLTVVEKLLEALGF